MRGTPFGPVLVLCLLALSALPSRAGDVVAVPGTLSDDDFYRAVSCGAAPGGDCTKPVLHWRLERAVRVSIALIDRAHLGKRQARGRAALIRAVQAINDAGAGLRLVLVDPGAPADIKVYFHRTDGSTPISDPANPDLDGAQVKGAQVRLWGEPETGIARGAIIVSSRLALRDYEAVMLEELTQAMGLMTDIKSPAYDGLSVFAEDSNAAKLLGPQDIMALRRHYAKRP